jgi:hypothetical protein
MQQRFIGSATAANKPSSFYRVAPSLPQAQLALFKETPMLNKFARKIAVGVTLAALITPVAFAASPTGTDPEPRGAIAIILAILGLT